MDDSESIPVPIIARSNELNQFHRLIPKLADRLEQIELEEQATRVRRIYDEHIDITHDAAEDPAFATYVSMPSDDWTALLSNMERLTDEEGVTRVNYLRRKFYGRLRDRMEELDNDRR